MKIALFIYVIKYLMYYVVECMTSSVISFANFSHFSNFNISGTNAEFVNDKQRPKSFVEFYAINLKNKGVKI